MRRETSDGQTTRHQTGMVPGNVFLAYDGEHSAGRFRGSARNDNRAALWPGFRGGRVVVGALEKEGAPL